MINFNSKRTHIISYCLVSFLSVAIYPSTYDYIFSSIGEKIGAAIAYIFWGLTFAGMIFLVRIIFNRKNKFTFFMNTLWCTTLASSYLGIIGTLDKVDTLGRNIFYHWAMSLVYTLPAIILAIYLYYKRRQAYSDVEKPGDFNEEISKSSQIMNESSSGNSINPAEVSMTSASEKESASEAVLYYYAEDSKPIGPLPYESLSQHNISANTLMWKAGMAAWKPAKDFPELHSILKQTPPPLA